MHSPVSGADVGTGSVSESAAVAVGDSEEVQDARNKLKAIQVTAKNFRCILYLCIMNFFTIQRLSYSPIHGSDKGNVDLLVLLIDCYNLCEPISPQIKNMLL